MAIVAHVLFVLQLVAVLFLQEVDRAVRRRDIPADLRLLFHVVTQEFPQGFAEDHVLKNNNNFFAIERGASVLCTLRAITAVALSKLGLPDSETLTRQQAS